MFGSSDAGGLGFQLSMYRLIDGMRDNHQHVQGAVDRENEWRQAQADYNQLLAHAQSLERVVQERNRQLAAVQNDLAMKNQRLESTQQELKRVSERLAFEQNVRRDNMIARQNLLRARDRERDAGSQPT